MSEPVPSTGRRIDKSIDIAAPVAAVWKAITDAEELSRWFPLEARVERGGAEDAGRIFLSWGESCQGWADITLWEPEARFQWTERREPVALTTDFILEARPGNTTRLRVVTAGFSEKPGWESEYDSIDAGWRFEMAGLRHYLERHRGERRDVVWIQRSTQAARERAFPAVLGPEGLNTSGSIPQAGESFTWTTCDGDALRGRAILSETPVQFVATIENLNHALLRVEMSTISPKSRTLHAWVWLSAYGVPAATLDRLRASWEAMADRLLPTSSSGRPKGALP